MTRRDMTVPAGAALRRAGVPVRRVSGSEQKALAVAAAYGYIISTTPAAPPAPATVTP